ncbi:hypothetical protein [Burkholderia cenocepacia]|uniref:hypothetical protein n=1 Tax=Burkholderia cenocepacia TaxID=95486 RepID=UPI0029390257|nr:hypothetical protein [Burkholderia cenocepacia]MDV3099505.1 hypothetical protein [Burkholderia cenocepacia]
MLYPELFRSLEAVRWDMEKDIPWNRFDAALLTEEQAKTIKMNAITEWSALPATEMFLRDNQHDSDFSAFMSVWFFVNNCGDVARAAFAKIGVLMASARRTEKPLHPTNLHVNQALFPRDTVQSRLPDPEWLERWLDEQIRFDGEWEKKVVERILHNLSILFERTFATAQELNRYRREVTARVNGAADGP